MLLAGAFVAGIIVPREGGLAIAMTEKLEDMVSIIFLPLVCLKSIGIFALSHPICCRSTSHTPVFPPIWDCSITVCTSRLLLDS